MAITTRKVTRLLIGAACAALTGAAAPLAAAAPDPAPMVDEDTPAAGEIVVTAERRSQSVQDVPATISVFNAEAIRDLRILQVQDIARLTPGLTVRVSGSTLDPQFTIRGIGMNNSETNQNPAVTTYLDEIALPSNALLGFQLFDLERVEVLKGPQGTLYGRNTTGGAVNLISKRPTQDLRVDGRVDFGDLNLIDVEAGIGGGLTNTLAGRVAFNVYRRNGWQSLIFGPRTGPGLSRRNGDQRRIAGRASLKWEPAPGLTALLIGDYSHSNDDAIAYKHTGNLNPNGVGFCPYVTNGIRNETACVSRAIPRTGPGGAATGPVNFFSDPNTGPRTAYASFIYGNDNDVDTGGFSLRVDGDVGPIVLTSVTGYRKFKRISGSDDGSPFVLSDNGRDQRLSVFQQEFRISSNEGWGPLNWIAGVYYTRDTNSDFVLFDQSDQFAYSAEFTSTYHQVTEAFAGFAQIDVKPIDKVTFSLGGRLTGEDKHFQYDGLVRGSGAFPVPVRGYSQKIDANKATWRAVLKYEPTADISLYGSVSTGFKGGGFPGTIAFSVGQLTPFAPETITAYEAGFKTALFDRMLRANAAIYHYDWKDFQATTQVNVAGVPLVILGTAGDAKITGVEAELSLTPGAGLSFTATGNYNDAKIKNGRYVDQIPPNTPKWMATGIARWEAPEPFGSIRPFAQVDATYNSKVFVALANGPTVEEPSLFLMGARAGAKIDGGYEVSAWVRNLTDELYRTQVLGSGSASLPARSTFGDPRTWGISLGYHF